MPCTCRREGRSTRKVFIASPYLFGLPSDQEPASDSSEPARSRRRLRSRFLKPGRKAGGKRKRGGANRK